jgi:hypothetical protein
MWIKGQCDARLGVGLRGEEQKLHAGGVLRVEREVHALGIGGGAEGFGMTPGLLEPLAVHALSLLRGGHGGHLPLAADGGEVPRRREHVDRLDVADGPEAMGHVGRKDVAVPLSMRNVSSPVVSSSRPLTT